MHCVSSSRAEPDDSKKWGMLNLVNQLFKIYFKVFHGSYFSLQPLTLLLGSHLNPLQINKLHLCKPLIRAIDSLTFKDSFSVAQLVTYK